jgi:lipoprotein-releasing system permease protein
MYQSLLTRRYLFSKVMPLLASVAVMLCSALVIVTWSVMGGFLAMLIGTGRTMIGDVSISWPNIGFPHYQDLRDRLEADPMVSATAPVIQAYGMVALPNGITRVITIRGVDGPSFARVTSFTETLWWQAINTPLAKDPDGRDPRYQLRDSAGFKRLMDSGLNLSRVNPDTGEEEGGVVMGIEMSGFNLREPEGFYTPKVVERRMPDGSITTVDTFLPASGRVGITVLPLDRAGNPLESLTKKLPVANEFRSGVYEIDRNIALVRLDVLQEMLRMNAGLRVREGEASAGTGAVVVDPQTGKETFVRPSEGELIKDPARVTDILIRGQGDRGTGEQAEALRRRVREIYDEFARAHPGEVPDSFDIEISTWEDNNRFMIEAVKKETALVLVLFAFMSIVAVFLVLAIFWSMISEKTKDIGILRALGASRGGIVWLWVRYGLAIGLVGGVAGLVLAYTIVWNINPIHEWMGEQLNIVIWDPRIYYFTRIPSQVDPWHAFYAVVGFVLSSAVGALLPAIRAAMLHPVKALRFE